MSAQRGFSLIEVLIALAISSMLGVSLYQLYRQIQRVVINTNNVIDIDTAYQTMYDRLSFDIAAIIVPMSYAADLKAKEDTENAPKKESGKKLDQVFNYSGKDGSFKLSFLTAGGIKPIAFEAESLEKQSTQDMPLIASKPLIRRVTYTLKSDQETSNVYRLMWSQSEQLDDPSSAGIQYELARGIKNIECSFMVYEVGSEKKKNEKVTLQSINSKELFDTYKTYVPAFIQVKGVFVDHLQIREEEFSFDFAVPSYVIPILPEEEKEQAPEKPASPEKPAPAKKDANVSKPKPVKS